MSDAVKLNLAKVGVTVGLLSGLAGLFGAWVVIPYRMDAAEQHIRQLSAEAKGDHEMLTRIDERTARIEKALDRLSK